MHDACQTLADPMGAASARLLLRVPISFRFNMYFFLNIGTLGVCTHPPAYKEILDPRLLNSSMSGIYHFNHCILHVET